jgi:glycerol-3-phosphate acyltransferase PlsY
MSPLLKILVGLAAGYLLGSIPTSYVLGRTLRGLDLREHGSHNLGATNVFRILGWPWAVLTVVVDVGKGALAVWLGLHTALALQSVPDAVALVAGCGAILGHSFSPFVMFHGGKGVATAAGTFLTLAPWAMIPAVAVWALLLVTTRIMSIASLAAAAVLPVTLILHELTRREGTPHWATLAASLLVGVFVYVRHRENILRIRAGTEKVLW